MNDNRVRIPILLLTVLLACSVPTSAATTDDVTIDRVEFGGDAVVQTSGNETYIWQSESLHVNVTVSAGSDANASRPYEVCTEIAHKDNGTVRNRTCKPVSFATASTPTVTFNEAALPNGTSGPHNYTVTVVNATNETDVETQTKTVHVLQKTSDFDDDRLTNQKEVRLGTDVERSDTDQDGIEDGPEVFSYNTSPLDADTDGDSLPDQREVTLGTDPTDPDTDGDGLPDGQEVELRTNPRDANADADDDGLVDALEVSIGTDPTARDTDADFIDDPTERRLGTDPTDSTTPFKIASGTAAVVAVLGFWVRQSGPDVDLFDRDSASTPPSERDDPVGRTDRSPDDDRAVVFEMEAARNEPITDDERVIQLLRDHGGQLRQSRIVEETEWSKSKVSRVLSRMAEDDYVTKITVGRENIITIPGAEPEGARSPFEN